MPINSYPTTGDSARARAPLIPHPPQKKSRLENGAVISFATPTHTLRAAPTISIASSLRQSSGIIPDGLSANLTQQVGFVMSSSPTSSSMAQLGSDADGMHQSLAELDAASHTFRLAQVENDHKRKGTGTTYDRHVRRYVQFWSQYQAELNLGNPLRVSVPWFPITVANASMFLQHESTREKVGFSAEFVAARSHNLHLQLIPGSQRTVTCSNVGKSSIWGAISDSRSPG
jgi:hypothetical protein